MEGRRMDGRRGVLFCPLASYLTAVLVLSVSSVHPAPTFPAIQGASLPALTTQPSPLVSGGFPPPEEEPHSQPVNPHSLHHLHAAYRVGQWRVSSPAPVHSGPEALTLCNVASGARLGLRVKQIDPTM